jgi:uncharacterized membrane protein
MARHQHETRGVVADKQFSIEQRTIIDDNNLLPPATELEKLHSIKPSIIDWIMQRAEQEQAARLDVLYAKSRLSRSALLLAFLIAIIVLGLGCTFILTGKEVTGSIFGGIGILFVVQAFLNFGRKSN